MTDGYRLGVDLGTTFSAAAVLREGRTAPEMVRVDGDPMVPSVVFLTADNDELVGSVAVARAWDDPGRTAREFKRRFGDPVPVMVGGASYSAPRLTALVLARMVAEAGLTEGHPPAAITLTHPANWGPYKCELFESVPGLAGLRDTEVRFVSEPVAAATAYASERPLATGDRVAVYDLGGGTFDAAVVQRTADGFEILREAQGIEQLGGVDFDEVVIHHVQSTLADRFAGLDRGDEDVREGFAHLRDDCRRAKELLSADTTATVRVVLPELLERVRLTRAEFEHLIRPTIAQTIGSLDAAIDSAGLAAEDLTAVLLVGGSSRIPLIADMLGEHLDRPVVLDAHPKYATAMGAALHEPEAAPVEPSEDRPVAVVPPTPAGPGQAAAAPETAVPPPATGSAAPDLAAGSGATGPPTPSPPPAASPSTARTAPQTGPEATEKAPAAAGATNRVGAGPRPRRRRWLVGVAVVVLLVGAGIGAAVVLGGDDSGGDDGGAAAPLVEPVATIELEGGEGDLAVAGDTLWVVAGSAVSRIDATTNEVTATTGDVLADRVAADDRGVWALGNSSNDITRIDPDTAEVTATIDSREAFAAGLAIENDIAATDDAAWASIGDEVVARLNPRTAEVTATIVVDHRPLGVAATDDAVWVTARDDAIIRIDPIADEVAATIEGVGVGAEIAATGDAVWVAAAGDTVARIDPDTNQVAATVDLESSDPSGYTDVAATEDAVWVVNRRTDVLQRVDPATGEVTDHEMGPGRVWAVAATDDAVWVSTSEDGDITVRRYDPSDLAG